MGQAKDSTGGKARHAGEQRIKMQHNEK